MPDMLLSSRPWMCIDMGLMHKWKRFLQPALCIWMRLSL